MNSGASVVASSALALVCGFGAMFAMLYLLRGFLKLQSKGNLDYGSVVGNEGTVYVTLPGDNQDGGGQIEVMIQGRLTTAQARKVSPGSLDPGQRVKITGTIGEAAFTVEPA